MEWAKLIPSEIIFSIVTGIITYLTTKRKYKAESKDIETQVTTVILSTYKLELDSMRNRIDGYVKRIDELEQIVYKLTHQKDENK